jgi:hypothetical protein
MIYRTVMPSNLVDTQSARVSKISTTFDSLFLPHP